MMIGVDLRDRDVLVVGGGRVAARRVPGLLAEGARVTVVAPETTAALARMQAEGGVRLVRRRVRRSDLDTAWFVLATTDDEEVNRRVAGWADQRRLWCVNASRADSGSARQAATTRHGPVMVGVLSVGSPDPRRSSDVRDAVAGLLASGEVDLSPRRTTAAAR
ncbi:precorrin-2 dehydrogenase/sirohydrochlorin ferrochelatase family protein [Aestuariimicrobium soli]|uniref:precorrin-2 dehydrogenase/sirohydrochlorin ferrochelatase family protein n=1 Tax=Aestuariimicrobium soli TaxID=2035834 RepID=UPI003EBDE54B